MTRTEFKQLTKMDEPMLKSLSRRGHLPFQTDENGARKFGEYTVMEAFLTVLSHDMTGHDIDSSRTAASNAAASVVSQLHRYWPEIGSTGRALCDGYDVDDEFLCGRFFLAGFYEPLPFCEPFSKLGDLIVLRRPVRIVATSASRGMAIVMRRAYQHRIEVPNEIFDVRSNEPAATPVQVLNPTEVYARLNADRKRVTNT